jgi:hypothetical protein
LTLPAIGPSMRGIRSAESELERGPPASSLKNKNVPGGLR